MTKQIRYPGGNISFGHCPLVMGILNVTPDSFSDGGQYMDPGLAAERAGQIVNEGADIIDVGGESTRPGAGPVSEEEEKKRVLPVIRRLAGSVKVLISIDSRKPDVVRSAVEAGARLINDVTGLRHKAMRKAAAELGLPVVIMHMKGTPGTMQKNPRYRDVVSEVTAFFCDRVKRAVADGVEGSRIIIDPGIGFGKKLDHNLTLIRAIPELKKLGYPVMIGASRKSMIGMITGQSVDQRLAGSIAIGCLSAMKGADILRVHDVKETRAALDVMNAIEGKID